MGTEKEAELRAITEEELTEVGARLGDEFKGNQKSSVAPRFSAHVGEMLVMLPGTGPAPRAVSLEEKIISP